MCNLSQGIKEQEGDYGINRGAEKMNLSPGKFRKRMSDADYKQTGRLPFELLVTC